MLREDYVIRIIRQAAEAIARMLKAREEGRLEAAERHAEDAYSALGIPRELIPRMQSEELARLFAHPEKLRVLSQLLWEEGELLRSQKDPIGAMDRKRRAIEILLEARRLSPDDDDAGRLQEMFRHVPTGALEEQYQLGFSR